MCHTHTPNPPTLTVNFQILKKTQRYLLVDMNPYDDSSCVSVHMAKEGSQVAAAGASITT